MNKVTVLFGAGADSVFGISDGKEFAEIVVGHINEKNQNKIKCMNQAMKEYYKGVLAECPHAYWYKTYCNNTIKANSLLESSIRKKSIEDNLVDGTKAIIINDEITKY